ncbi:hypothetical protein BUALT_Bualt06G0028400 [Buddleja alternifolia]|uniref:DUF8040 domain-containing protein n=1 Tax=Buddleja alternifolia TaxID=168488 RepID=A0AAV6XBV2_9LAMI|nr:hypothetical protein BUALT_Bualt06G0028400 [Buddleja alternifolia]
MAQRIPDQVSRIYRFTGNNNTDCLDNLRMDMGAFVRLCYLLHNVGGLSDSKHVRMEGKVCFFLTVLAHHKKNRIVKFDHVPSGHTVSKYFNAVLISLLKLHPILLVTPKPVDDECTVARWKHFKIMAACGSNVSSYQGKKVVTCRQMWTKPEEDVLVQSLKEIISTGWKADNGFRVSYLNVLQDKIMRAFPRTDLRANPHISSKMHSWKKQYNSLYTIFGGNGVG